jgi:UDP-3-O-[3-hydroxymyristoyl] glucosamine N-acyltransferase
MEITLSELASVVGGRLDGPGDLVISAMAAIEDADEGQCTFLGHERYLSQLEKTGASAVILPEGVTCRVAAIRAENPYVAFLKALQAFAPKREDLFPPGIHPTAVLEADVELGEGVHVGAHAVVGPRCRLGDRVVIAASTVLLADVIVGDDSLVYPMVTVRENCEIGARVVLHAGAVVGSDGFGFVREEAAVHKIPQIGKVVLEDDVEIGANVCIDRATTGRTVIAAHAKIDNLVQIGHNVRIGERTAISAQTGISGSSSLGDDCVLGGQVGLADHVKIGNNVRLGGRSGVIGSISDGQTLSGYPARDHREWRRLNVHFSRLAQYADELKQLRRRLDALEGRDGGSTTENA